MPQPNRSAEALFKPSAAMRRYAAACVDPATCHDEQARCVSAGTTVAIVQRWRGRPGFGAWLNAEVRRLLAERLWEVWATVNRLACEGNLTAARILIEYFHPDGPVPHDPSLTFQQVAELAQAEDRSGTEETP